MNRRETTNAIAVMQAWVDGKGAVQCVGKNRNKVWCDCDDGANCSWDWDTFTYRMKPVPIEVKAWAVMFQTEETGEWRVGGTFPWKDRAEEYGHESNRVFHVVPLKGSFTCEY